LPRATQIKPSENHKSCPNFVDTLDNARRFS
jgi:hypothetical protein